MVASNQEAADLVRALIERVFNGHDVDAADELIAPDYIQNNPEVPPGRDGFKAYFTQLFQGLPDYRFEIRKLVVEGDLVAVLGQARGTHRGELLGLPATGKEIVVDSADFFRVEDDRIKEHWDVVDKLPALQALGAAGPSPVGS